MIPCAVFLQLSAEIVAWIIVILLMILSTVVSVAKAVFMLLSPGDFNGWEDDEKRSYRRSYALMQEPEKLLATLQVANIFVNLAIVILAAYTFFSMLAFGEPTVSEIVLVAAGMMLILLVFTEIVPRRFVSQNELKILPRLSLLLLILQKVFYPLSAMLLWSAKHSRKKQGISIDDLSHALEKSSEASENENILKGIVKFGNIDVHTIMTPRTDVESVDISTGLAELITNINEWGYSRIPVHDGTPDNVKGILYVKDLLPYIEEMDEFQWQKLIRDAYFVPENKKIDDLLNEFQEMKIHLAVIIDEYGGMVGIVTLEDILEEIVGDIADESDDEEQDYIKIDEYTYLFDGKVLLNDFFRIMHLDESDFEAMRGEADTLAGVILEMKGEIPKKGDSIDYKRFTFCVESVDSRRIKQIKVVVHE